jgi:hypothetical protein
MQVVVAMRESFSLRLSPNVAERGELPQTSDL